VRDLRAFLDILLFALAVLAAVALVPLHLAEEHHGEEAAEHEGEHHAESDHEVVAPLKTATPTVDVRPSYMAGLVEAPRDSLSLVMGSSSGEDLLADVGEPDASAAPPSPPRAPPILRA
jgi:hypothetical protein